MGDLETPLAMAFWLYVKYCGNSFRMVAPRYSPAQVAVGGGVLE